MAVFLRAVCHTCSNTSARSTNGRRHLLSKVQIGSIRKRSGDHTGEIIIGEARRVEQWKGAFHEVPLKCKHVRKRNSKTRDVESHQHVAIESGMTIIEVRQSNGILSHP
ncbi:hypothetical protein TNCV_4631021 [Trichonephila clavipes]|nr:hypothetical protein TNCV_4631021 [Trichonephila clavipes]